MKVGQIKEQTLEVHRELKSDTDQIAIPKTARPSALFPIFASSFKVEVLWEDHKILRNHHFRFDFYYIQSKVEISQKCLAFSEYLNFN